MPFPISKQSLIVGELQSAISSTATTFSVRFDEVLPNGTIKNTGVTLDAETSIFTIDRGSDDFEYIYAPASTRSVSSGVTTFTLGTTGKRGLAYSGAEYTTEVAGNKKAHSSGAKVEVTTDHYSSAITHDILNGTTATPIKISGRPTYDSTGVLAAPIYADATARDAAIPSPQNGDLIYNTADGVLQQYISGAWTNFATGTTSNASTTVSGKVEEATTAEMGAGTATGGTGARLFVNSGNLVKTSSGAADENKIAVLNASGQFASGFLNLEVTVKAIHNGANLYTRISTTINDNFYTDDGNYLIYFQGASGPSTTVRVIDITNNHAESFTFTASWAQADYCNGAVKLGNYLYLCLHDSGATTTRIYRYAKNNLAAGGTLMTAAFLGTTSNTEMTSNGTDFYFTHDGGDSANDWLILKATLSGTTLTEDSVITCGAATMFSNGFGVNTTKIYGSDGTSLTSFNMSGVLQAQKDRGATLNIFNSEGTIYLGVTGALIKNFLA